jgi:predicted permease
MSQLRALVWLKWRLFRNSMRSRKAVKGRLASALATLAALAFSLAVAAGLGSAAYFVSSPAAGENPELSRLTGGGFVFFLFALTFVYMMWAVVPLGLEGGSRFEPRRLLLYPVSLPKLFAVDLVSELTNLSSIFAVPIVAAVCVGAGLGRGAVVPSLGLAALALVFGVAVSKLFSTFFGSLMAGRRTRGEALLAILGAALGLSGVLMGQLIENYARYASQYEGALRALRWTPPGALALGLTDGLTAGGAETYWTTSATLAVYVAGVVLLTYLIARRTALGVGGAKRGARPLRREAGRPAVSGGWQLPLMSAEMSAVVEKELRYASRSAQLRGIALMAVALTVVMRLASGRGSMGRAFGPGATDYTEGMQMSYGVLYVFLMISALTTNLFGYEGAGMRTYVLAPVDRRVILAGKNVAMTLVVLALASAAVAANVVFFRDLTGQALLATALSFVTFAALFALGGNWLSINFPKRIDIGRRMNRSGVAGLLILPLTLVVAAPPAAASLAGWAAGSVAVRYVILALFALASVAAYTVFVKAQARTLAAREVEIMEAVAGRDDDSGQVMN